MRVVRHASSLPPEFRGGCLALGNFDGVHRGHQRVIGTARAIARDLIIPLGVMTFEPHPRRFFDPHQPPFALTTFRTKARLIARERANLLYVQHFDAAIACEDPDWFIEDVLVGKLAVEHVVVGQDYAFGKNRAGTVTTLQNKGLDFGFGVTAVAPVYDAGGAVVSSTRIREALAQGEIELANALLGHPWEMDGRVEHGEARGRKLGFPTANLHLGDMQAPAMGVYAITATVDDKRKTEFHAGVANFGVRPTFGEKTPVMEVHLLDFNEDLYGKHLRVRFHKYLRPERSFSGIDALKAQIADDIETARRVLSSLFFGAKGIEELR